MMDAVVGQEAINITVAGSDTTATTLTYLVYEVLRHPEIKAKLVEEIEAAPEHPSWERLETMTYLNYVIQETLRVWPAAPASLPRVVPGKDGVLIGGYRVPSGTTVSTQAYTVSSPKRVNIVH